MHCRISRVGMASVQAANRLMICSRLPPQIFPPLPPFHRKSRTNESVNYETSSRLSIRSASSSSSNATPTTPLAPPATWNIKMLYDGDCPLCMREVDMLRSRDAGKGNIAFVDIASPEYNPADNADITFQQAMEKIHAIEKDGTVVTGIEVFRRLYEEVGLGWVYAATKIDVIGKALTLLYDVWAKYRLPITGRPDMEVIMQEKKMCRLTE